LVGVVIFFQAIITIWLSPKSYEQGGYSWDSFSHTRGPLQGFGHAF
jgi:hypothetical protein